MRPPPIRRARSAQAPIGSRRSDGNRVRQVSGRLDSLFDLGLSLPRSPPCFRGYCWRLLPRTLELILAATILALVAGIPLGIASATRRGTVLDSAITAFVSSGIAIPVFVFGTVLVLIFAPYLHLLPAGGFDSHRRPGCASQGAPSCCQPSFSPLNCNHCSNDALGCSGSAEARLGPYGGLRA